MRIGLILPMGENLQPGVPLPYADIRALTLHAEAAGLDAVWTYDHLVGDSPADSSDSPWEAWSVLTALAEATERVSLGVLVLATPFRNPGVLARMADTVQDISGNRLVLGLGAGWHQPEFDAFGIPFKQRVSSFAESLEITTTMLRDGRATLNGAHNQAADAPIRDRPGRKAPEILVAAKGPRMLELTARFADTWNLAWFGQPTERYLDVNKALTEACEKVGRDPATLRRTVGLLVGEPKADADENDRTLRGDAAFLAETFAKWEAEGVSEIVCSIEPSTNELVDLVADAATILRGR
jgi:alkanesulfonate monooxygenase SsuD/methylene tetrahydromethanopterin reductase-like flavin-dependent oxidoreductase (luciferase family)